MAGILDTRSWQSETLTRALVAREDCDLLAELIVLRDQVCAILTAHPRYPN